MPKKLLPIKNSVKDIREGQGITQIQLGESVNVTRQTIAAIEQRRYSPSLETAFRIARAFNLSVTEVFEWDELSD